MMQQVSGRNLSMEEAMEARWASFGREGIT